MLMRYYMTEVSFSAGGNSVAMYKLRNGTTRSACMIRLHFALA